MQVVARGQASRKPVGRQTRARQIDSMMPWRSFGAWPCYRACFWWVTLTAGALAGRELGEQKLGSFGGSMSARRWEALQWQLMERFAQEWRTRTCRGWRSYKGQAVPGEQVLEDVPIWRAGKRNAAGTCLRRAHACECDGQPALDSSTTMKWLTPLLQMRSREILSLGCSVRRTASSEVVTV